MNFLDQLPLSPSEKAKLLPLAAPTPSALLGMIRASPDAFARYFGDRRAEQLVDHLTATLDPAERDLLARPARDYPVQESTFSGGRAPNLLPTAYDIQERDRIFAHLQALRAEPRPSDRTREEIASCEAALNALLD